MAREIELDEPFENMGTQLVKQVATKTNDIHSKSNHDNDENRLSRFLTPTKSKTIQKHKTAKKQKRIKNYI